MTSNGLNWKLTLIGVTIIGAVLYLLPNFINVGDKWFFSKEKIKYGLDIQGGLHLVMGVDVEAVMKERLERMGDTIKQEMTKESVAVSSLKVERVSDANQLTLGFASGDDLNKTAEHIKKTYYYMQELERTGTTLTYKYLDSYVFETKKATVEQAIETIRNRIDEFGVSEPSITAQGTDRILVQLPGLKEAATAKDLINRTARLDFLMVSQNEIQKDLPAMIAEAEKAGNYSLKDMKYSDYIKKINEDLKGKLPDRTKILFQKAENTDKMETGKFPYLLETNVGLGGDAIKDAFVSTGEYNEPVVSLHFNAEGAHKFAELTGANVNRLMAIVLDDVVYSAPSIKQKIAGGSAQITLGGGRDYQASINEAKMISMALRAGALPARLEQLEERTVGPSLGADSIKKGERAAIVSALLVFIFMVFLYKSFGLIANFAILLNITFLYAVLTALGATLTLPGIAGIALTVGMAVDANVIINERIKEELKRGMSFAAAIKEGYHKAFSAIFDSNVSTAATSVILMYFGTGPVRGFAVTLLVGIVMTMFCNVFITHVIFDLLVSKFKVKKFAI